LPRLWALATMSVICIEDDKSCVIVIPKSRYRNKYTEYSNSDIVEPLTCAHNKMA